MYNLSYASEKAYEALYESQAYHSKDCPDCINGEIEYSSCCGADMETIGPFGKGTFKHICIDCNEICEPASEKCDTCKGEGVL